MTEVSVAGSWAITTDGVQWILQRVRGDGGLRPISFVRTSKDTLRRCCRENGVSSAVIEPLLAPLPDYFPGWDMASEAFADGYSWFIAGKAPRPVLKTKGLSIQRPGPENNFVDAKNKT